MAMNASFFGQTPMGVPPCGTDAAHVALLLQSPTYASRHAQFHAAWHASHAAPGTPSTAALPLTDSLPLYTIPTVVHVIHRGSPGVEENISDAQILSAIDALNEDFREVPARMETVWGWTRGSSLCSPSAPPTVNPPRASFGWTAPAFLVTKSMASPPSRPFPAPTKPRSNPTTWLGDDYLNVFVVPEINGNNGGAGVRGSRTRAPREMPETGSRCCTTSSGPQAP